ncbi:MAG TPA: adenylate/guanylate cyclase domain-containing protein, partial [Spirochaetales bacterium]|nr:adenylate/guanylate cyclase domain-containing protein [Spirochaetales bacterium]
AMEAYKDQAEYLETERDRAYGLLTELSKALNNIKELRSRCESALKGKICVVGWVGTGTTDIGVNPFDGEYINVGTHAAVAETILRQSFIRYLDPWVSILLTMIVVPLLVLVMGRFRVGLRTAFGFGGAIVIILASYALFAGTGVFLSPLPAVLASLLGVITREAIDYMSTEREKSFLRKAFGTYLSSEVVEQIVADPSKLTLGGQSRFMTAMFTDIKGFSTISEQLSPEALVSLLNKYLSGMSDIILDQKGTIDKYEGDAIIAFFGAPLDLPEHARNACRSAILMKRLEEQMNTMFLAEGLSPTPIATRIGINSGDMVVGNMGTERKMNYTMMGSAVNLAARLEG